MDKKEQIILAAMRLLTERGVQATPMSATKRVMPVHSGKFSLAQHSWDEPLNEVSRLCKMANIPLMTPVIGEVVRMEDKGQEFREWWKGVEKLKTA